uniref:Association with the SNF1 complex (ASC) domain-containing protein n=1 Tax=Proboscia inermis TaxID=420281 RepID=A0A7S0C984_9STRA|mmetsp:Transcript_31646/g.31873  ORF Transcript_31646/g.31873 Transcript_31646/m.31873 type:complete len:311 (+) Transcript_31646:190-1122(+)|eukprot:CAMPEP_0171294562 /NCGR_PEP_ID=MMETSP0816-20121228/3079_1 /TAXON_ID=420281 /ORGANISM="Proboscia inermis, Strain CCAP1064/1" /LENGTH=310 /DNA_ID=CAMNT_0011766521 /DNA_START=111 /DNA_END=1043 /DNA_ORIENTATION=-
MGNAPSQSNVADRQTDAINRAADAASQQQQYAYRDGQRSGQARQQGQMTAQSGPPNIAGAAPRNYSDMSISGNSDQGGATMDAVEPAGNGEAGIDMIDLIDEGDESVPTVFRWEHGGRQVYITGTFNGWSRQIPMHRSGNDFTYIHNLKKGKHAFKFIVDDEWRFAPDQPTVADIEGRINNFIDVSDFKPYTGDKNFEEKAEAGSTAAENCVPPGPEGATPAANAENFSHSMPDLDEYTKEPPPLPPHLRHIILNKAPQLQDTAALPVPQHVALNHLYCTAIKDNMMVLGITQRHKTKFVTTVYYSPCSS